MKTFYDQFHPAVEKTLSIKTEHKVGERMLGEEPGTGQACLCENRSFRSL